MIECRTQSVGNESVLDSLDRWDCVAGRSGDSKNKLRNTNGGTVESNKNDVSVFGFRIMPQGKYLFWWYKLERMTKEKKEKKRGRPDCTCFCDRFPSRWRWLTHLGDQKPIICKRLNSKFHPKASHRTNYAREGKRKKEKGKKRERK